MTHKEIIQDFKNSFGSDLDYIQHVRDVGKTTVRCEFVDWLDYLGKDKQITQRQVQNTVATDKELFNISIDL